MDNIKRFTIEEVYDIIDEAVHDEMNHKNRYIELNGYTHKDTLCAFDNRIAAYTDMYRRFKGRDGK